MEWKLALSSGLRAFLQSHADSIDTGPGDEAVSRALVVYNLSKSATSGLAQFAAEVTIGDFESLPNIKVTDQCQRLIPCRTDEKTNVRGVPRVDHTRRVSFYLSFIVPILGTMSWYTFAASYAPDDAVPVLADPWPQPNPHLHVIETSWHAGLHGAVGNFDSPIDAMLY